MTTSFEDELVSEIPSLRRFALSKTSNPAEADDLVQDCVLRALDKRGSFEEQTNLRAWLFTILRNRFLDEKRKITRRGTHLSCEEEEIYIPVTGGQEQTLELKYFRKAFESLPGPDREVLSLVGMEGLSYEEAAGLLDIPVGTVRSRLSRARSRLRKAEAGTISTRSAAFRPARREGQYATVGNA